MSRRLIIEPEAEADIAESADWYEQRNPVARERFLSAIDQALRLIERSPERYQIVYRDVRRALVDGFRYAVFYRTTDTQIIIVSCFHTSRNPKIWRDRLQ
jgi:plasmid stabilization system protein ParE